ncbi:unnamed protein product [Miscanthus lutarioriparius]|uniref:RIN4 pathogenic type III effector avirulence factor Avr cleavage site domain-containing protein n=1 Tax=Miscanthus lutarioriparius TaxID=422564 RepID=A0A811PWV1_9POAL|nr:unnamed protein product [Miscanthus lutarioriparius]
MGAPLLTFPGGAAGTWRVIPCSHWIGRLAARVVLTGPPTHVPALQARCRWWSAVKLQHTGNGRKAASSDEEYAGHAVVPKFGSWDAENVGYTVFFEKVRDNKAPPAAPPAPATGGGGGYDFDPYEHYESLSRKVPSRPPSSHGHGQPAAAARAPAPAPVVAGAGYDLDPYEHYDSLSSRNVASRPPSSHGHAPAAGYDFDPYEHYENLSARSVPSRPPSSHGHGLVHAPRRSRTTGRTHTPGTGTTAGPGATAATRHPRPAAAAASSRRPGRTSPGTPAATVTATAAASRRRRTAAATATAPNITITTTVTPPPPLPRRPKPSAVPRFGVWDEQNAAMAAQGFTVQFEKVKRHREEASRTAPAPPPKLLSPDHAAAAPRARRHGKRKAERSFMSRMYRCLFPRVRE